LHAHADAVLWDQIGRTVATIVVRRLLTNDGAAGWDRTLYANLLIDLSPAVRALGHQLGHDGRHMWRAKTVTTAVQAQFELYGAWNDLYGRLRQNDGSTHLAPAPSR